MNQFSWEITGWSSRIQEIYWSFVEEFREYISQIHREKPKDVNMWSVGLGNTRTSTDYANISSRTLLPLCSGRLPTILVIENVEHLYIYIYIYHYYKCLHNISMIHNNILWDWQYFMEYSPHLVCMWGWCYIILLVPQNSVIIINNFMFIDTFKLNFS